jgi:hypothetical protein
MKVSYNEVSAIAEYGRVEYGYITYPVQLASKMLVEQGTRGRLKIYPNGDYYPYNEDGDGLPDVVYPSVVSASNNASTHYLQKGHHYAAWYPIAAA